MELIPILESGIAEYEQVDLKVTNTFSEGVYVRELEIPKGTLIEGKRHRKSCINMLIKGKMLISDGKDEYEVTAPFIANADALTKKFGFALEDSIWINIHNTSSTDLDEIEKEMIITESEYLAMIEHKEQ